MKSKESISETPERIRRLPRYGQYPIPYFVMIAGGVPDFRVLDPDNYCKAITDRLCGICGVRLGKWIYFIGGPVAVAQQSFKDLPMHKECAEYSFHICPFLRDEETDYSTRPYPNGVEIDGAIIRNAIKLSGLYKTTGYSVKDLGDTCRIIAYAPAEIRWFLVNKEISAEEAMKIIANAAGVAERIVK